MGRDRETLIRLADEALYRSKQAGRDAARSAIRRRMEIPACGGN